MTPEPGILERANPEWLGKLVERAAEFPGFLRAEWVLMYRVEAQRPGYVKSLFTRVDGGTLIRALREQKEKNMLELKGKAEFKNEGKMLEIEVQVQPHFPNEHEMLERVAKQYDFEMVKGRMVIRADFHVPAKEVPAATEAEPAAAEELGAAQQSESHPADGAVCSAGPANSLNESPVNKLP